MLNLENKTKREVEKELISRSTAPENFVPEKIRVVSDDFTEIKFLVDEEFLKDLEELKNLAAHRAEGQSVKDFLAFALKQSLQQLRPKAPKEKLPEKNLPPPVAVKKAKHSRYIAADVKRQVWQRDKGQCTYQHAGRRCCSKHALEFDHVKPFSLAGESTV